MTLQRGKLLDMGQTSHNPFNKVFVSTTARGEGTEIRMDFAKKQKMAEKNLNLGNLEE